MTYEEKSAIVIEQLRADRDRLLGVLDKIKAEIEETYINITYQESKDRGASWGLRKALEIIDKHRKDGAE